MATPTRRTPSHPNQSSPAPRSVPSPVAARQAGKTPVNHPTGSTGSKTLGSTPMMQNLSQTGNTSSPSANMLNFGTPSGLGIDGITPVGLNLATPGVGGAIMVPTMSDLGLNVGSSKRNEDEERRTKMRQVLKRIGKPKGRVSEEGIARVARRVGFQNDIDVEKLTPEEKERKVGNRPIQTGGKAVIIDFHLKNSIPQNVQVDFGTKATGFEEEIQRAGQVLLNDLIAPDGVALDARLDRFAMNLERLARMDRLSSHGINCFEALAGIYTSLSRLFEQEKLIAQALFKPDTPDAEEKAATEVMCKKSGRPLMHARGRLGLEIVYWRNGRKVVNRPEVPDTEMRVDGQVGHDTKSSVDGEDHNTFTLRIEAEACPAGLYPSIRVSNSWLPDPLELLNTESGESIPWQDPPPTYLAANFSAEAMIVDGEQKLPDLRFVAKLDPPLVMPYQTALNVLSAVNVPAPQTLAVPPQYAAILLDPTAGVHGQASASTFTKRTEQTVLSQQNGEETTVKHSYTLTCAKPNYADYGFKIHELPFSHPRQLVELLPTLRQWASIGSILQTAFASSVPSPQDHDSSVNGITRGVEASNVRRVTLDELLTAPTTPNGIVPVDVTLATSPTPTLGVTFPTPTAARIGNVKVQILPNAEIHVSSHGGIGTEGGLDAAEQGLRLARALDVCDDLGVWIEWMRTQT